MGKISGNSPSEKRKKEETLSSKGFSSSDTPQSERTQTPEGLEELSSSESVAAVHAGQVMCGEFGHVTVGKKKQTSQRRRIVCVKSPKTLSWHRCSV